MRVVMMFVWMLGSFSPLAWACDPNRSCGFLDAKCEAEKLLCRTQCTNINSDADMHIKNSQVAILTSEEKIVGYRDDIGEFVEDLESAQEQIFWFQKEQESLRGSLLDLNNLLSAQAAIQTFVVQIKEENPVALTSVENVEKLIHHNSSNIELVLFLTAYSLVLAQNEELASELLSSKLTDPIYVVKTRIEEQLVMSSKNEGKSSERYWALRERKRNKERLIADEFQKIKDQEENILDQEDRKCPPIL